MTGTGRTLELTLSEYKMMKAALKMFVLASNPSAQVWIKTQAEAALLETWLKLQEAEQEFGLVEGI